MSKSLLTGFPIVKKPRCVTNAQLISQNNRYCHISWKRNLVCVGPNNRAKIKHREEVYLVDKRSCSRLVRVLGRKESKNGTVRRSRPDCCSFRRNCRGLQEFPSALACDPDSNSAKEKRERERERKKKKHKISDALRDSVNFPVRPCVSDSGRLSSFIEKNGRKKKTSQTTIGGEVIKPFQCWRMYRAH